MTAEVQDEIQPRRRDVNCPECGLDSLIPWGAGWIACMSCPELIPPPEDDGDEDEY